MSATQSVDNIFSVRIVSFDHYMSPPIPDLDFSYSSFQGRNVEEVPVIRIYGSTPAGQKACLHIHRALPYLYILCPDNVLNNPEEGDRFIHMLSNALEKALKHKGGSTTQKQHVHECHFVRARKLYGYHSSDDLFVKIYLYYPHEVARASSLLLDGAVLDTPFQPYESHIPYLLQFLVDYNLYGMGHIHSLKFKFRPPVPDIYISNIASFEKQDMQTQAHGNSAFWLSSTVPGHLVWPASGDGLEDKTNYLFRRQSTCALEVDASVDDILNQKYRMYTSLSQTRSDVKMVQSLVAIWEEEYERSGTPAAVKSTDQSKPTPENVLASFTHGLDYEKALDELCAIEKSFPHSMSKIKQGGKVEDTFKSSISSGKESALLGYQSSCIDPVGPLKCIGEEKNFVSLPRRYLFQESRDGEPYVNVQQFDDGLKSTSDRTLSDVDRIAEEEFQSLDTEALGLLRWLTSSQAAEDFNADDELVNEAILSPLLSAKSYKEALELAHLDYESASQKECQDILDSLEEFSGFEGFKERISHFTHEDSTSSFSSDNVIPQNDGAFDDEFRTPQNDDISEANINSGRDKDSAHGKFSMTRSGSKRKRSKLSWGQLPFCFKEGAENPEPAFIIHCQNEMKNDDDSSSSSGIKSSVRDLMRRKRCLRTEQSDKIGSMHYKSDREDYNAVPHEGPDIELFRADNGLVHENATCSIACTMDACIEEDGSQGIDYCSPTNQKPLVTFCSGQEIQSIMQIDGNLHLQKLSTDDITDATNESKKVLEPFQSENLGTSLSNMISGSPQNVTTDTSLCSIRTCNSNSPAESKKCTSSIEINPSTKEDLNKCVSHSIDELLVEKLDVCTVDLTTTHVEQTLMHDPGKYKESHDDEVVTERGFKKHTNCHAKLDFTLHRNVQRSKNNVSQGSRDNLDFDSSCSDLLKGGDTHDSVEMTFGMIPPSRDDVDKFSLDSPEMMGHVESYVDLNANRQHVDNFLLISPWKFEVGISYERLNDENLAFNQEPVLGVPTHFQNDGSVLYLLTPAVVPPTMETVHQWFSELQDSSPNSSGGVACDAFSPESNAAASHVDLELHEQHVAGTHSEKNVVNVDSHDFSQISGPDREEKSNLTPLSQMGFRDTASTGGGQQLTLISMEVQAESRRDLRPDPKVDAINVISLVIQDDSSHKIEVFVLMRGQIEEQCWRNVDGLSNCKFSNFNDEKHLLDQFVKIISSFDPDILLGWEIQGGSLGFIAERAAHFGISLLKKISRTPKYQTKCKASDSADPNLSNNEALVGDSAAEYSLLENEWSQAHASGIHVSGRIVLNIWQLMRSELKLHMYSAEAVAQDVLRRKIPSISYQVLNEWFLSGPGRARHRCIEYVIRRAKLNLEIMNQLDMINRTSELARVFGIDFFSVLSRGSQFRVESMLLRLAHTQNYVAISPGNQQVASQPAMECLPLVMEPKSGFYADPVVVLDFQSLYPSMIIGYNLCYTTCLGSVVPSKSNVLGVTSYLPNPLLLKELKQQLLVTPNGIMYVPSKVRRGVLPRLLEEILSTRIMVKQAMKKLLPSQQILQRILNARQLALKLIANVTYGYTAAGFSGRMPCAELADSIVQCGRRTLETAISFVNRHDRWKATVIYGDTDSMFVLLKDRSREDAFRIGNEIASAISAMNPDPVILKMEKIYQPCFLLTKKRYVGYSYESPHQEKPIFDAKGIETVRRDTCPAVAKILERSIRLFFEHQNITEVKNYLLRQWRRTLRGKISLQDFIFSKEVRLGSYSSKASSLPPAAIVAIKAMQTDRRASPHYGERIPYVVIHGEPGARLVDMVINPYLLLDINSPYRLNELYYIKKQIIPALQRVFGLVGVDLNQWFSELPRSVRQTLAKSHSYLSFLEPYECDKHTRPESFKMGQLKRSRIDTYYISKHCTLCGELAHASDYLCDRCSNKRDLFTTSVVGKASRLEREIQHLAAICRHCGGGDWIIKNGVKCTSLACSVFYERQKVQKDLQGISSFATAAGLYPRCIAEWF